MKTAPHSTARWPMGAWFGCQVGGTVYLLTGAVEMAQSAPSVAIFWGVCFAVANLLGTWLWRCYRIGLAVAPQLMLIACGVVSLAALVVLDVVRPAAMESGVPVTAYLALVVMLALLSLSAARSFRGH